jgi:hypothetical protein
MKYNNWMKEKQEEINKGRKKNDDAVSSEHVK